MKEGRKEEGKREEGKRKEEIEKSKTNAGHSSARAVAASATVTAQHRHRLFSAVAVADSFFLCFMDACLWSLRFFPLLLL
jgi:hypothetical protein